MAPAPRRGCSPGRVGSPAELPRLLAGQEKGPGGPERSFGNKMATSLDRAKWRLAGGGAAECACASGRDVRGGAGASGCACAVLLGVWDRGRDPCGERRGLSGLRTFPRSCLGRGFAGARPRPCSLSRAGLWAFFCNINRCFDGAGACTLCEALEVLKTVPVLWEYLIWDVDSAGQNGIR